MIRELIIDKMLSHGIAKEEAEFLADHLADTYDIDKIYSLRIDNTDQTIKVEQTQLSAEELYKAAYIHYTSEFFKTHRDMYVKDAVKLMKLNKKELEMQAMKEVLEHGESR